MLHLDQILLVLINFVLQRGKLLGREAGVVSLLEVAHSKAIIYAVVAPDERPLVAGERRGVVLACDNRVESDCSEAALWEL